MTLWISLGTAAELIKVYPLLHAATQRGIDWRVLSTGQSPVNFWQQWDDFGLPRDRTIILQATQRDLESSGQALKWFGRALLRSAPSLRKALGSVAPTDCWLVHGDTLSTLLGSVYAYRLGIALAHVEAGLRSSSLWSPFPEEITRRLVSRLATMHFAPGDTPTAALALAHKRRDAAVVNTVHNTLLDTLRLQLGLDSQQHTAATSANSERRVVVNIHRFENINHEERWQAMISLIEKVAETRSVQFVLHPITRHKFTVDPASYQKLMQAKVQFMERQVFSKFIRMMYAADYIVSDGGSNQEECYYMGKPCLILRHYTERTEGLGANCLLSRFDPQAISEFIATPERWARPPVSPTISPTDLILNQISPHSLAARAAA
jgi:UDP-N-acetylglucosamine 2-epimerase (non-hydrolysing)